jgi:hypothetical protein
MTRDLHDVVIAITGAPVAHPADARHHPEQVDEGVLRARDQDMPAVCLTSASDRVAA